MDSTLSYFARQGRISDPGAYAPSYRDLPSSIPELVELVRNLTIHVFWAERYGLEVAPARMAELQLRTVARRLAATVALDPRPLTDTRPLDGKLLGNCRDHAVLLASFLRHRAIPARARCGFAAYFLPNHFEDHWVTEYWNADQRRWILADPQLDALQCEVLRIRFDPLDVPRDQFITGGLAWQMCRRGEADPDQFGIGDLFGLGFVRGDLVRDVAALNKMEMLPWDCWGIILSERLDDEADLAALDEVAALTAGDVLDFDAVCRHYERDARLRVDGSVLSYVDGQMVTVNLE